MQFKTRKLGLIDNFLGRSLVTTRVSIGGWRNNQWRTSWRRSFNFSGSRLIALSSPILESQSSSILREALREFSLCFQSYHLLWIVSRPVKLGRLRTIAVITRDGMSHTLPSKLRQGIMTSVDTKINKQIHISQTYNSGFRYIQHFLDA